MTLTATAWRMPGPGGTWGVEGLSAVGGWLVLWAALLGLWLLALWCWRGVGRAASARAQVAAGDAGPPTSATRLRAAAIVAGWSVLVLWAWLQSVELSSARRPLPPTAPADDHADRSSSGNTVTAYAPTRNAAQWRQRGQALSQAADPAGAARAYEHALREDPDNVDLMLDYAVALGMSEGATLAGRPQVVIEHALTLAPHHRQALALAGSAAFEAGDYPLAVQRWQTLLEGLDEQDPMRATIERNLQQARRHIH